jgi:REP element-mobilizing transposase RayT
VIAYHLVWVAYGWWLGNDPRGSMSKWIRSDLISELGELHHGRKRIQPKSVVIREFYERAGDCLKRPLLILSAADVLIIAKAIAACLRVERYTCYALAIMPDHIHILIRKHKHKAEQMIANLQRCTHLALREAGARDWEHPVWGGHGWKVFLDSPEDVWRTIPYIQEKPAKMGFPKQE